MLFKSIHDQGLCTLREGWGPVSPSRPVDFTLCFQYGILVLNVSLLFILAAIYRLAKLKKMPTMPLRLALTNSFAIKMLFSAAALFCSIAEHVFQFGVLPKVNIVSMALASQSLSVGMAIYLQYYEQLTNYITSTPLLLYWLSSILVSAIRLRTEFSLRNSTDGISELVTLCLFLVLQMSIFIIEAIAKQRNEYEYVNNIFDSESSGLQSKFISIEERANIFSKISFSWISPLVKRGNEAALKFDDVPEISSKYKPERSSAKFIQCWQKELDSGAPSLTRAIIRSHWDQLLANAFLQFSINCIQSLHPILLSGFLGFVSSYSLSNSQPIQNGYFYVVMMYVVANLVTINKNMYNMYADKIIIRMCSNLSTALYAKVMVLSNDSKAKYTLGEITTLSSTDILRIARLFTDILNEAWSLPMQLAIGVYLLYSTLGWSVFVGIFFIPLGSPITAYLVKMSWSHIMASTQYKEKRIKAIEGLLSSIKLIKLYAWEVPFLKKIKAIRNDQELESIRKYGVFNAYSSVSSTLMAFMVSFSAFAAYSLFGKSHGPLTPQKVFVSLTLFQMLDKPINNVVGLFSQAFQAVSSIKRLQGYLNAQEIDKSAINHQSYDRFSNQASISDVMVNINNGSFKWLDADPDAYLKNINLQCKQNELVAVVGKVGSGKSSLAAALLGDMIKTEGTVSISGRLAYVSQQPWIINATIQDNILLGYDMEPEFYNQVLEACALKPDLEMFAAGDQTEVGEKGITLSGGQKARLSLARAVYARADVYILDDPLAAVDPHVSKHLFRNVIGPNGLLSSYARIFVTNAVQYLKATDNVVLMSNGEIAEQSDYISAMSQQKMIYDFVHKYVDVNMQDIDVTNVGSAANNVVNKCLGVPHMSPNSIIYTNKLESNESTTDTPADNRKTITTEVNKTGNVSKSVYMAFIKMCGLYNVSMFVISQVLTTVCAILISLWLKYWSEYNNSHSDTIVEDGNNKSVVYFLSVFAMLGLFETVLSFANSILLWAKCSIQASKTIHESMLKGVIKSPMSFFDTTPMGRIINRFSGDITTCDFTLPWAVSAYAALIINIVGAVVVVVYTAPVTILLLVPISFIYQSINQSYLNTDRELTRIKAATGSPIVAHLQTTIGGVSSIRAYGHVEKFKRTNNYVMGNSNKVTYISSATTMWRSQRINALGDILLFGATLSFMIKLHYSGYGDSGLIGLAISQAIKFAGQLNMVTSTASYAEKSMTIFERTMEYANLLPEAPDVVEENRPVKSWPEQGQIEFKNYSTCYREGLDLVLDDISFIVEPKQKVGIVGRTGAGKSSLTLALFRIIEATKGQIYIDGKDIAEYGLYDLRSKLSIIPQDPVLFAGTVRENLDPFGEYNDEEIWLALEYAHLADYVKTKDGGLDFDVMQGGDNFSVGQRQLICLARALLKKAKILVLDEATAAIDNETDAIIQESIRREFKDCTVLTIAHRLNTIIDSDKILVIDNGGVAEYDTPEKLLSKERSIFAQMLKESNSA